MPASNLGPSSDLSLAMLGLHAMKYGQRRRIRPRSPADPHGVTDPAWRTLDACEQSWPFFRSESCHARSPRDEIRAAAAHPAAFASRPARRHRSGMADPRCLRAILALLRALPARPDRAA